MHLTAQDKRAAREGFAYVVIRGGKRVCYASTLGEAKRECGKQGKVVAISGMTYAAKNPKRPAPPPKSAKEKAIRTTLYYLNTGSHEWPIGRFSSKKDAREYAKQYFGADVLDSQWKGMRILSAKEREDEFWGERNPLSGGEMSRSKAEAAYARADRAYTKAVETYGGFDAKTVAAYRRRQKAEQALHAILRRNPSAAQVGHSVGKHAKYAARGAKKVGKKAWAGTKSFFGSAYASFKKHNPSGPASPSEVKLVDKFLTSKFPRFSLQDNPTYAANAAYLNYSTDDIGDKQQARSAVKAAQSKFPHLKISAIIEPEHYDDDRLEFFLLVSK